MSSNRYGVDTSYFKKNFERAIRDLGNYTPTELLRTLSSLMDAVRPTDACAKCGESSLVIFDDESNECLKCQNIQNVKGT